MVSHAYYTSKEKLNEKDNIVQFEWDIYWSKKRKWAMLYMT